MRFCVSLLPLWCYHIFDMPLPSGLPKTFQQIIRPRLNKMLEALYFLTNHESPSTEKAPADRCCKFLADLWLDRKALVGIVAQKHRGDHLRILWPTTTTRRKSQLLVLGHYDTVYPIGTLAKMPIYQSAGKFFGPGTFDMKAGIVQALFALEALQKSAIPLQKSIVFLWTSDEEIGSESSRKLIENEALRSDAVFVLEPALGRHGNLKTSRKGVGEAQLTVHGRASHAGLAPEQGINAIHELAAQIARIEKWNDHRRGITINADMISGGSRTNVIADHAKAILDLRAWKTSDMLSLEKRLQAIKPIHRGAKIEIRGGFDRPPLERKHSSALYARAKSLAKQLGLNLGEAAAGGGSDGNFTAALGIPTLDGLGAVGDGAHSPGEHIVVKSLPERAALLAALLATS